MRLYYAFIYPTIGIRGWVSGVGGQGDLEERISGKAQVGVEIGHCRRRQVLSTNRVLDLTML